ncbi:MAG: dephospho-CoA kinase [Clostridiales bacterium]|nr:dephospho-CoA kinase [Clostridiales bacterium]
MDQARPYIVGLTGGIASGKTAASEYLASLGALVIDADAISRHLTRDGGEALPAIRQRFGEGVMDGQSLNRRALAALVFGSLAERRSLEAILHPMVQRETLGRIEQAGREGAKIVFLSVPLLFETGMDVLCDEVWLMALEHDEQLRRLMARDQLTCAQAESRIQSQMPLADKLARATHAVRTNRPIAQTRQELDAMYRDLKKRVGGRA